MATHLIFRLLGLPSDTDAERLRSTYEGAIGAATARGDWKRAAELSSAFDQLPQQIRLAVYSGRDRHAPRWIPTTQHNKRRASGRARSRPRRQGRSWRRILLPGLPAIVSLVAVATWLTRHPTPDQTVVTFAKPAATATPTSTERPTPEPSRHASWRSNRTATAPIRPLRTRWSPMRALYPDSGAVLIPHTAIIFADGHAHVLCPNGADGSSWQLVKAAPGQHFICPSGYVGVVRVPATREPIH